jgi:hypothetical protein
MDYETLSETLWPCCDQPVKDHYTVPVPSRLREVSGNPNLTYGRWKCPDGADSCDRLGV